MDIYTYLQQDHQVVRQLLTQISHTKNSEEKINLWQEVKQALLLHNETEHATFYHALVQHPSMKEKIVQSEHEHALVQDMLQQLSQLSHDDNAWMSNFQQLVEAVNQHVNTEEGEIFTQAKTLLTEKQSLELAEAMASLKQENIQAVASQNTG